MLCSSIFTLVLFKYVVAAAEHCSCGWKDEETGLVYTHRIFEDFSKYPNVKNLLKDDKAKQFTNDWMIYDF